MASTKKAKTLFQHLSGLKESKTPWDSLSVMDKKTFEPFMVNRFLSMNMGLLELVNELQKFTIGQLSPRDVYKMYFDFLPKKKTWDKYIKGKKVAKYNNDLVKLLAEHFELSKAEATQYVEILCEQAPEVLYDIVHKYGKTDKEIKSMIRNR